MEVLSAARGGGCRWARRQAVTFLLLVWVALPAPLCAQNALSTEYQLKAVFLFNFTQFVEWPREAFPAPNAPLVIGVLGADPFGTYLDETARGERINGHPLEVRRYRTLAEVGACHVLFVSASEAGRLSEILQRLRGRSTLTVGDIDQFAMSGGMIRFLTERNRIRLRVNLEAAKAAGLTISSKLLRSAEIVSTPKE